MECAEYSKSALCSSSVSVVLATVQYVVSVLQVVWWSSVTYKYLYCSALLKRFSTRVHEKNVIYADQLLCLDPRSTSFSSLRPEVRLDTSPDTNLFNNSKANGRQRRKRNKTYIFLFPLFHELLTPFYQCPGPRLVPQSETVFSIGTPEFRLRLFASQLLSCQV